MSVPAITADHVPAVRAFNRFYTNTIGALRDGLLRTPYSLAEARVLFELGQRDAAEVSELRRMLNLDGGYLSRLLARLEGAGLVARERSSADARRQIVRLTDEGGAAYRELDARSAAEIGGLLDGLADDDRRRLVAAMGTIQAILEPPQVPAAVVLRPPAPGDLGWIVQRHGALYTVEYGWDERFEALVARVVADYAETHDPRREAAWVAEVGGERAGCVLCVRRTDAVAQLRLLLVEPRMRGLGVGSRLVEECLRFARRAGYAEMNLWTNDVLHAARRIYERAGFRLVAQERHSDFGPEVAGQNWSRPL